MELLWTNFVDVLFSLAAVAAVYSRIERLAYGIITVYKPIASALFAIIYGEAV